MIPRLCKCNLAAYCTDPKGDCLKADRTRHVELCKYPDRIRTLMVKVRIGSAALYRICCGIFPNPCQAYAYALLCRLQCPKGLVSQIPINQPDDPKWLFSLLKSALYNIDDYVDILSEALCKTVKVWRPVPELVTAIQIKDGFMLRKLIEELHVTEESACLFLMLAAHDTNAQHTLLLLSQVDTLYEKKYDESAHRALLDLYTHCTFATAESKMLDVD